jgi:hypothetical protein
LLDEETSMKLTLYIADRKVNNFMKLADLCPYYKVFVTRSTTEDITRQGEDSDEDFVNRIIESSRLIKDFWIPAVLCKDKLYCAKEIKVISDGSSEMFL